MRNVLKFECFFHVLMLCALPDYASMLRPMPFNALGLAPELLQALKPKSYPAPTPVQSESIPPVLEGRDVLVSAPTGSGKTAAYALPLLQRWISASLAHLDTPHTRARGCASWSNFSKLGGAPAQGLQNHRGFWRRLDQPANDGPSRRLRHLGGHPRALAGSDGTQRCSIARP